MVVTRERKRVDMMAVKMAAKKVDEMVDRRGALMVAGRVDAKVFS